MKTKIRDLSHDGRGIGTIDGKTIFVENAYPEELVEVKITKEKKKYLEGKIVEIIEPSKDRIESICSDFYRCSGCQYCDYKYQAQIDSKINRVKSNLKRLGNVEVEEIKAYTMEDFYNYRNHIQLKIKDGKIGYVDKENYSVFTLENCVVAPKNTKRIIDILQDYPEIFYYNLIGLRENHEGKLMLILVENIEGLKFEKGHGYSIGFGSSSPFPERFPGLIEKLKEENVSHIYENYNTNPKYHYGQASIKAYGEGEFQEEILGNKFILSPTSFFQVNRVQAEVLYKLGIDNLDFSKDDKVLELFSGIGTISMELAKKAKEVVGIEYSEKSVKDATQNAKENGLENTEFLFGKVEEKLDAFKKDYNKLLLDPPRAGADKKVIEKILEIKPEKISYISCDPATMARDIGLLIGNGDYKVEKVDMVDMFPLTSHVECVALIQREIM